MAIANIDDLFKPQVKETEVELPDYDGTFKVRGLNRAEALELQSVNISMAQMEQRLLSLALLEPKLTEEQVRKWQENATAGALEPLSDAILELSGMKKAAAKEAMKRFRD